MVDISLKYESMFRVALSQRNLHSSCSSDMDQLLWHCGIDGLLVYNYNSTSHHKKILLCVWIHFRIRSAVRWLNVGKLRRLLKLKTGVCCPRTPPCVGQSGFKQSFKRINSSPPNLLDKQSSNWTADFIKTFDVNVLELATGLENIFSKQDCSPNLRLCNDWERGKKYRPIINQIRVGTNIARFITDQGYWACRRVIFMIEINVYNYYSIIVLAPLVLVA